MVPSGATLSTVASNNSSTPTIGAFTLSPTLKGELEAMGDPSDPKNESMAFSRRAKCGAGRVAGVAPFVVLNTTSA